MTASMKVLCGAALAVAVGAAVQMPSSSRGAGSALVIHGDYKIAGFAVKADSTLAGAIAEFGTPDVRRRTGTNCKVVWRSVGVSALFYKIGRNINACDPDVGVFFRATMTGHGWHTANGLRVGASAARVREVFPRARFHKSRYAVVRGWWLVVRPFVEPFPGLLARMNRGRVAAFVVTYPAGGI